MEANGKSSHKVPVVDTLPREVWTHMYSAHIGNQAQSSTNTTNVQFGEPVSLLGAACRNTGKGILRGAETIQITMPPMSFPAWVTAQQS